MPSNPTTKSQVHAYKFVLRRMQSALVRKDAVMLHDPMRTHSRATIVGVVLTALAVLGFIIFGFFKPAPSPPGPGAIVIGEPSGQMYITTGEPMTLVPTFNLASARLLLMAQQNRGGQGPLATGGGASGSVQVAQPEVIPDDQLVDIPRGQPTGIAFGPPLLPTKQQRISARWAVCEQVQLDPDLPDKEARDRATTKTTVVAGVSNLGSELGSDEALLVTGPQGANYLVYRLDENPNRPNADVVRARVDLGDDAVVAAYGLTERPRKISREMLSSIPEAQPIAPPPIDGNGQKWQLDLGIGEVFYVAEATGGRQYYVLTRGGKQEVSKGVADLIRYQGTNVDPGSGIPERSPDEVADVPPVGQDSASYLDVAEFPKTSPTVLGPASVPTACLGWNLTGQEPNREGHTTLYVSRTTPVPTNTKGASKAVDIQQASPGGYQVDSFYMPPGRAAVVRSVTSKEQFGKGPIQLVSSLGVRYGVPAVRTANVLGLTPQKPAPELILRLLPTGPSLNVQNAQRTWPPSALAQTTGNGTSR